MIAPLLLLVSVSICGAFPATPLLNPSARMATLVAHKETWHAATELSMSYQYNPASSKDSLISTSVILAKVNLTTTRPTLNLDNFAQISSLQYSFSRMKIYFNDSVSATSAFTEWSASPVLTVLTGHEWNAFGDGNVAAFEISNLKIDNSRLSMAANPVALRDVIADYNVDIIKSDTRNEHVSDFIFPLNLNYANGQVSNPSIHIALPPSSAARVDCVNCYTTGSAEMTLSIKGGPLGISSYGINLNGTLQANIDFAAMSKVSIPESESLELTTLAQHAFPSLQVPGLFNITPAVFLDAGIALWSPEEFSLRTGFEVTYPFRLSIGTDKIINRPSTTYTSSPVFTPHKPVLSGDVRATPHMIPKIELSLGILGSNLQVTVQLDNKVAGEFNVVREQSCAEKMNVEVSDQHAVTVGISAVFGSKEWVVYDTGATKLNCKFCHLCPLK